MGSFTFGKSLVGSCGEFVIIHDDILREVEESARAAKAAFTKARQARSLGDLSAAMHSAPQSYLVDVPYFLFDEIRERVSIRGGTIAVDGGDEDYDWETFDWDAKDALLVDRSVIDECLERAVSDPDVGMPIPAVMDTSACYASITRMRELAPFVRRATHGRDAGVDDIDGAVAVLKAAGHSCVRDDERIARVFGTTAEPGFMIQ